jgi:hypothetical protein
MATITTTAPQAERVEIQQIVDRAKAEAGDAQFEAMRNSIKKICSIALTAIFCVVAAVVTIPLTGIVSIFVGPLAWLAIPAVGVAAWLFARHLVNTIDAKDQLAFDYMAAQALLKKDITTEEAI